MKPTTPIVHSITDATQARSDDMDARIRRYLVSMGLRTVCVILVIAIHNPVRWVFAVFAVILPYIAVVMANAAGNRRGSGAGKIPPPASTGPTPMTPIVTGPTLVAPIPQDGDEAENPVWVAASPEQANSRSHEQTA